MVKVLAKIYGDAASVDGRIDSTLEDWSRRKHILLLNVALTVPRPKFNQAGRTVAGAHIKHWTRFTQQVLNTLWKRKGKPKFVCWGLPAKRAVLRACAGLPAERIMFSYHPVASKTARDEDSFSRFWEGDVGKSLKLV